MAVHLSPTATVFSQRRCKGLFFNNILKWSWGEGGVEEKGREEKRSESPPP